MKQKIKHWPCNLEKKIFFVNSLTFGNKKFNIIYHRVFVIFYGKSMKSNVETNLLKQKVLLIILSKLFPLT